MIMITLVSLLRSVNMVKMGEFYLAEYEKWVIVQRRVSNDRDFGHGDPKKFEF